MKFLILLCFGTLLTACQNGITESFNADETTIDWVGENPVTLINAKGNPTQIISSENREYLIYMHENPFCQTTYTVEAGIIVRVEQQGESCNNIPDKAPTFY